MNDVVLVAGWYTLKFTVHGATTANSLHRRPPASGHSPPHPVQVVSAGVQGGQWPRTTLLESMREMSVAPCQPLTRDEDCVLPLGATSSSIRSPRTLDSVRSLSRLRSPGTNCRTSCVTFRQSTRSRLH